MLLITTMDYLSQDISQSFPIKHQIRALLLTILEP